MVGGPPCGWHYGAETHAVTAMCGLPEPCSGGLPGSLRRALYDAVMSKRLLGCVRYGSRMCCLFCNLCRMSVQGQTAVPARRQRRIGRYDVGIGACQEKALSTRGLKGSLMFRGATLLEFSLSCLALLSCLVVCSVCPSRTTCVSRLAPAVVSDSSPYAPQSIHLRNPIGLEPLNIRILGCTLAWR